LGSEVKYFSIALIGNNSFQQYGEFISKIVHKIRSIRW